MTIIEQIIKRWEQAGKYWVGEPETSTTCPRQIDDGAQPVTQVPSGLKWGKIELNANDIAELEAMQARLAEPDDIVRPRPMEEAPHDLTERLISDGESFYIGAWSTYRDRWVGDMHEPTWVDANEMQPIPSPRNWWSLDAFRKETK